LILVAAPFSRIIPLFFSRLAVFAAMTLHPSEHLRKYIPKYWLVE
jgi:hypothetical protein